jgi:plasmid stability protein
MGRSSHKKQVVVYLPAELHQGLRTRAARSGRTISALVEEALRAQEGQQVATLSAAAEPRSEIVDALVGYGAPLYGSGDASRLSVEEAVARGLELSRKHAAILRVLPLVLHRNRGRISWRALRRSASDLAALGMLLDLTAEVTGERSFQAWAARLPRSARRAPPELFFETRRPTRRYLELAEVRTPEVVRRWGFLMATPLEDFRDAYARHGDRVSGA